MKSLTKKERETILLALVIASEQYQDLIKIQKTKAQKLAMWNLANNAMIVHAVIKGGK